MGGVQILNANNYGIINQANEIRRALHIIKHHTKSIEIIYIQLSILHIPKESTLCIASEQYNHIWQEIGRTEITDSGAFQRRIKIYHYNTDQEVSCSLGQNKHCILP